MNAIAHQFGSDFLMADGALDRQRMRTVERAGKPDAHPTEREIGTQRHRAGVGLCASRRDIGVQHAVAADLHLATRQGPASRQVADADHRHRSLPAALRHPPRGGGGIKRPQRLQQPGKGPAAEKPGAAPASSGPAGAAGGARPGGPGGAGGVPGVEVAKVKTMPLQDDAQAVGSLKSRQSVTIKPETAGRVARIAFPHMTESEGWQIAFDMQRTLGTTEDLFFAWDEDDTVNKLRRSFLARMRQLSPIEAASYPRTGTVFELKEQI